MLLRRALLRASLMAVVLVRPDLVTAGEKGWSVRELPPLDPVAEHAATATEEKEIRALIKDLARIDAPDLGYCSTVITGDNFLPVPGSDHWGGWTVTRHNLKPSKSLRQLVEFGAKAVPFLLESLTDETPTKLTLRLLFDDGARRDDPRATFRNVALVVKQTPDGGMEPGREFPTNPMNAAEMRVARRLKLNETADGAVFPDRWIENDLPSDHIKDYRYTITVGDLCFVAIGQITNRPYRAARYQSTGFVVVNSPAHDAKLADAVRAVWKEKQYRQQLFKSLVTDFYSRGSDERGSSDRYQIGAAIRLLYYFPAEGGPLVAKRLHDLDLTAANLLDSTAGWDACGLWADELVEAVKFSKHPQVRQEMVDIFRRTVHAPIALATLAAVPTERNAEASAKLKLLIKALPSREDSWDGTGFQLLKAMGDRFNAEAGDVFRDYLKNGGVQRKTTLCRLLREDLHHRAAVALLKPLLDDQRPAFDGTYRAGPGDAGEALRTRICDEAALTIAANRKDVVFKLHGTHNALDRQIDRMRAHLADEHAP